MSISRVPYERETVYQDLREYRLEDTGYCWKLSVSPMNSSFFRIRIALKKKGLFKPAISKSETVVDRESDDMVSRIKQSLDAMLGTEEVKKHLSR